MIAPIVIDVHTTTVENGNCPWICLSSQLASCRSQNRTLIHQAVSLHACHLHSSTCLPSTEKNTEKAGGKKYHKLWPWIVNMQTVFDKFIPISRLLRTLHINEGSQQLEGTSSLSINFVLTNDCKLSRKKLSLYSLALWNRHSRWGRWHRRRICHIFMAKAATVTIGASALQKVTANGPVGRASTRYDLNHSVTFWWSSSNKWIVFKDVQR